MNIPSIVPNHIGFIVDGNRRWAKEQGKNAQYGHEHGFQNLKKVIDYCRKADIKFVTAYIFSRENWKRSEKEVSFLMELALRIVERDLDELHEKNVKLMHVGSRDKLSKKVLKAIDKAVEKTANNDGAVLGLCFNYGGQYEIVEATKQIVASGIAPEDITEQTIADHLYAPEIPPVDFVLRTSGEHRLSNFMLWRAAYAELYFPDTFWPDLNEQEFESALAEFANRQRRYGQ